MPSTHPRSLRAPRPVAAGLALAALALPAASQLRSPGQPASARAVLPPEVPTVELAPPAIETLRAEDAARNDWPLRWGAGIPVSLAIGEAGRLDVTPEGELVWRLRIESPGALSLMVELSEYHLPPGGRLFLHDDARELVLGAYTDRNHKPNGQFAIEPVPGDAVTIEYVQPASATELPDLRVGTVWHDYRGIVDPLDASGDGGGAEGTCLVDVNCPAGDDFQDAKHSVARILSGGTLCSGSLLNNTAEDARQLFLSANHCGGMNNAVFLFNYERSGCGTGFAPQSDTVQGSVLLQSDSGPDYRLIEITEPIPASFDPWFAGWNRTPNAAISTVSIGHPSGGPKKISVDQGVPGKSDPFWAVTWEAGTLEGGSSGGPLMNAQGKVIGPACCVSDFSCSQTAFFGRLELYWSQISQHLDPLGLAPTNIEGFDPDDPQGPPVVTGVSPATVDAVAVDGPATVTLSGSSFNGVSGVSVDGIPLATFPAEFQVVDDGTITLDMPLVSKLGPVDVKVTGPAGSDTAQVTVVANDPPVLELAGTDPSFLLSEDGIELTHGGEPGELFFSFLSTELSPSSLPGLFDLAIGNGLASLFLVASPTIGAAGHGGLSIPFSGIAFGTQLHFQAAVLELSGALPLTATNLQTGTVLL